MDTETSEAIDALRGDLRHLGYVVGGRIDTLESGIDRVDTKIDRVDAKVDRVDAKVDRVDAKIDRVESTLRVEMALMREDLRSCLMSLLSRRRANYRRRLHLAPAARLIASPAVRE